MNSTLYGLQYLKDDQSVWSSCYMFSHSTSKLKKAVKLPDGVWWYAHRSDTERQMTEEDTISYTTNYDLRNPPKDSGPYYKIVELPLII